MPHNDLGSYRIYVPLLFIMFSFIVSDSVTTNLIIFRTCYVTLNYNATQCALLGTKDASQVENLEKLVEPTAATIKTAISVTGSIISGIICLFVGPWSDRFGRKPLLILPLIGFGFSFILNGVFSILPQLSPWYMIVCTLSSAFTGGVSSYITGSLCYITDITTPSHRGFKIGLLEAVMGLGALLGNISTSYIFSSGGYPSVYAVGTTCCILAAFYTFFFVPESLANRQVEGKFKSFFQTSNMREMVRTLLKTRPFYLRGIVLTCMFMLIMNVILFNADSAVFFLYLREKFQWSLKKFTFFNSVYSVMWIVGALIGVYVLHKLLEVTETVLILIGFISMMNGALLQGLATTDWGIYAASAVRCMGAALNPMLRSLVSKIVSVEEIGKIFAVFVSCEGLFSMLGSPFYTAIYNATIQTNPEIFNYVSAGLYLFQITLTIFVIVMLYLKSPNYGRMVEVDIIDETAEQVT